MINIQPEVSTPTRDLNGKIDKIKKAFKDHPEGLTPKQIALLTNINVNTVKSTLPCIYEIRNKQGVRGLYELVEKTTHAPIFQWAVHNMRIACEIPEYDGKKITEPLKKLGTIGFSFGIGKKSKKATLMVSSEPPMNISSICAWCTFFVNNVKTHTGFSPELKDIWITSVEFNRDFLNLRLDGVNCVTLDSLITQFKIYEKKFGVRVEHKIKGRISIQDIFYLLNHGFEYAELHKEVSRLNQGFNKIWCTLGRMADLIQAWLNKKVDMRRDQKERTINLSKSDKGEKDVDKERHIQDKPF